LEIGLILKRRNTPERLSAAMLDPPKKAECKSVSKFQPASVEYGANL
jgi:hypothetical protein